MRKLLWKTLNFGIAKRMLGWHLDFYLRGKGGVLSAGVLITDGCNCRCIMCDIWKNREPTIYPREAQERAIDALARMGCVYYSISGGEPTLARDLPERIAYACRRIPHVHLVTNGLLMTPEAARALGDAGLRDISVSLDGSEAYHNAMRGRPDAYDKAWRCIERMREFAPKANIVVNSVVCPYNIAGLRELRSRIEPLRNVSIKYLPQSFHEIFRNEGQAPPAFGEAAPPSEIRRFLEDACGDSRVMNSRAFLRKAILYFQGVEDVLPEQTRCLYPYHSMEFDCRGFAYLCGTGQGFEGGVPPEENLEEFLRSPRCAALRKNLEGCAKCRGSMMLCYYEPRLNFPLHHLIYHALKS